MTLPLASWYMVSEAWSGAFSRKSMKVVLPLWSRNSRKPPPPRLPAAGCTTARAKPVATAASTALPPARSVSRPASEARWWTLTTMACRARTGCSSRLGSAFCWEKARAGTKSAAPSKVAKMGSDGRRIMCSQDSATGSQEFAFPAPQRLNRSATCNDYFSLSGPCGCCVTVAIRRPCAGPADRPVPNARDGAGIRDGVRTLRMSQQPESTSTQRAMSPATKPVPASSIESSPGKHAPQRIPRWLELAELFLRVLLRMYIGLAVCYVPWSRTFWDQNPLFEQFPTLSIYAANGAVRGLVSGLGLLNLWIAFHDALRHRNG